VSACEHDWRASGGDLVCLRCGGSMGTAEGDAVSITCPRCGMTSYNPTDVEQGYCGNCHDYTGVSRGSER
jgi:ribosomal protein L37E